MVRNGIGINIVNDHLREGKCSPGGADGKWISQNVYILTKGKFEEKLVVVIEEVKREIADAKEKRAVQSIEK